MSWSKGLTHRESTNRGRGMTHASCYKNSLYPLKNCTILHDSRTRTLKLWGPWVGPWLHAILASRCTLKLLPHPPPPMFTMGGSGSIKFLIPRSRFKDVWAVPFSQFFEEKLAFLICFLFQAVSQFMSVLLRGSLSKAYNKRTDNRYLLTFIQLKQYNLSIICQCFWCFYLTLVWVESSTAKSVHFYSHK